MAAIDTAEPATVPVPTRVRYQVLAAVSVLAVITYIHRVGFATAAAEFKGPLGLNQRQLGYLMAAFGLAYGGFEIPWGWLSDRFGARHLLAVIIIGGSLVTASYPLVANPAVMALAPDLTFVFPAATAVVVFLLVLRFLFGMFQAGTFPAISRVMTDWMPATERGGAQGVIWTASRLGGALSPLLIGRLTWLLGGWKPALVAVALLGAAWCLFFWPWFRNRPVDMSGVNEGELKRIRAGQSAQPARKHGHDFKSLARMSRSKSVWALCLMYGCLGYSGNFFLTLLPDYLRTNRHLDSQTADWLASLPFAFGVVACLTGGIVSDLIIRKTGDRSRGRCLVGATGLVVAGIAVLATLWVSDVRLLGLLLCLTFFGNDLAMAPSWSAAADLGKELAGTLGGAMNMLGSFTMAIMSLVTGIMLEAGWVRLPFVVFACSYALGAFLWFHVDVTESVTDLPHATSDSA